MNDLNFEDLVHSSYSLDLFTIDVFILDTRSI